MFEYIYSVVAHVSVGIVNTLFKFWKMKNILCILCPIFICSCKTAVDNESNLTVDSNDIRKILGHLNKFHNLKINIYDHDSWIRIYSLTNENLLLKEERNFKKYTYHRYE